MTTTKTISDPQIKAHIAKLEDLYTDWLQASQSDDMLRALMDVQTSETIGAKYPDAWAAFLRLHGRNPDGSPLSV